MNFIMDLSILSDWKGIGYNSILIIIDGLMNIVYNKLLKVTINTTGLVEMIINVIMRYYGQTESIISD